MDALLQTYFMSSGIGWAVGGAMLCVMFGGWGSASGLRTSGAQAAGVLAEKPELFGKLLVLVALPGTQGFYALIMAIMIALRLKLLGGEGDPVCPPALGLAIFFLGIGVGVVQFRSAAFQGEASAAAINLTARRPEESGRSILFPALVETYAVVALLAGILMLQWLTSERVLTWLQTLTATPAVQ